MTPHEFDTKYRSLVGVRFNWERFLAEGWPVVRRVFSAPQDFSSSFAPWYLGTRRAEVAFNAPDATPVRFGDIPRVLPQLSPIHQLGILSYVEIFRHHANGVTVSAPAYVLPNGRFVALDGNHRLAALVLVDKPCRVEVDEVGGPLDAGCLADLEVHQGTLPRAR
jgi:hypothetical protein